jgi:hypothetical protein
LNDVSCSREEGFAAMNLTIWIPAMMAWGLATMGLLFAFVYACDKV